MVNIVNSIILHIAKQTDWNDALQTGFYGKFSIEKDGFIHCAKINNIITVANDNLKNLDDSLLLLSINTEKLKSKIKWEKRGKKGINFPHIYGLLNIDAVFNVCPFKKDNSGNFYLPQQILRGEIYK